MENFKTKLIEIINSKPTTDEVKENILIQINERNVITKEDFESIVPKLDENIIAHSFFCRQRKKISKQVLKLERHAYAPEMNKLYTKGGGVYKVPQCKTIDDAIKYVVINHKSAEFKY